MIRLTTATHSLRSKKQAIDAADIRGVAMAILGV